MDPKPSGLKRNTSDYALNCEDTGMPLRPGMIYSVSLYAAFIHCMLPSTNDGVSSPKYEEAYSQVALPVGEGSNVEGMGQRCP